MSQTLESLAQEIVLKIEMYGKYSKMHESFALHISNILLIRTSEIITSKIKIQDSTELPQYIIAAEINSNHNIVGMIKDAMILYDGYNKCLEKNVGILNNKSIFTKIYRETSNTKKESIMMNRLNTINGIVDKVISQGYQDNIEL